MEIQEALHKYEEFRLLNRKENTVKNQLQELKRFFMFARKESIEDVTVDDIVAYLWGLSKYGWDQNSVREKSSNLRCFFKHFRLRGEIVINEELIPLPRRAYKQPRVATREEIDKLLAIIPRNNDPRHIRNLALIRLLVDTGVRNSEVLSLNVENIDLVNMRTVIATKKSRGIRPFRQIYWFEETNEALKAWLKKRDYLINHKGLRLAEPNCLFMSLSGGMHASASGKRIMPNGLSTILRTYSRKAGIETVNPHAIRHYNGHELILGGGANADVMNALGHANVASTTIYTMMSGLEFEPRFRELKNRRMLKNGGV